ncbi:hypothetical protein OHA40_07555 [Nocardia sp. NBC_00508]|uniref:hypothetical protein n=1 Tax=Nocardia sp. NBC_00508 TaxID=2975992 RepID=UPI002E823B36|nr:hypothetical protein [Nocardia sp. NBC_00508]WUD67971.1 hypothetical protein OHA40_07555 [Nocardia sp. NBC_00508]
MGRSSRRRAVRLALLLSGGVLACLGGYVAILLLTVGTFPWTQGTYTTEGAAPCELVDGSVLRRWTGVDSTSRDNSVGSTHACKASSGTGDSPGSASIEISVRVTRTDREASFGWSDTKNFWLSTVRDERSTTAGDLPNLGQDAFFVRRVIGSGWVDYRLSVLDANLTLDVNTRVEFHNDVGASADDMNDIQAISEQHARRALDQLRR